MSAGVFVASKSPTWDLVKSAGGMAADALLGSFPAASLLKRGAGAVAECYKAQTERRYEEFVRAALEGDVFPENAEDMSAEELMGMLRLCMADIEQKKAPLYGRLAKAIAQNKVPANFGPPLMVALSTLTLQQAERLRRAWVAKQHTLLPAQGSGNKSPADFLGNKGGVLDRRDHAALVSQSLVEGEQLTSLGNHLVEACFLREELTPEAIGERVWLPGVLVTISYDLDQPDVLRFVEVLANVARSQAIKCGPAGAPQDADRARPLWMIAQRPFVVIVGQHASRLLDHMTVFERPFARGFQPIVVFLNGCDAAVSESLRAAVVIDAKEESQPVAELVVRHVLNVLSNAKS
ncbi:hypothetical protein LQ772_12025 [Frateuria edaphi]|uniref:hypothetical protein n=1 Tax=Frateuria edaphi TaxID=2898793 RepID=UPI001E2F1DA4|nr:hypothetical protein [Frateuria edaphi]UGB44715.1 hypothetical protein LQ772_12025 [Frateuria edaphi]